MKKVVIFCFLIVIGTTLFAQTIDDESYRRTMTIQILLPYVLAIAALIILHLRNVKQIKNKYYGYYSRKLDQFQWLKDFKVKHNGFIIGRVRNGCLAAGAMLFVAFIVLNIGAVILGFLIPFLGLNAHFIVKIILNAAMVIGAQIYTMRSRDNPNENSGNKIRGLSIECPKCRCPHSWAILRTQKVIEKEEVKTITTTTTTSGQSANAYGGGMIGGMFASGPKTSTSTKEIRTYHGKEISDFMCENCGHKLDAEYPEIWKKEPDQEEIIFNPPEKSVNLSGYANGKVNNTEEMLLKKATQESSANASFVKNVKHTFPNGTVYEGSWADGNCNGKGKSTYKNGNTYEGEFTDGLPHGKGKFTWKTGDVYEGDFVYDKKSGKGKFTWVDDGTVFEGDYADDKFHGKGKTIFSDGKVYEGDYFEGNRTGFGKMTYPDGKVEEGKWENGKFLG